jgi:SAM-dependent methyltransferase
LRLDLGCGTTKKEGFIGVDSRQFPGVDVVHDLTTPWPWKDDTVDEVFCNHFLEHLGPKDRIHFANELWRVLKKGAKAQINTPDAGSPGRAFGDLTHQWPPVAPMSYSYWNREWRMKEAPHLDASFNPDGFGFKCDFDFGAGYGVPMKFQGRAPEFIQFAFDHYLDARGDLMVTLTARKP